MANKNEAKIKFTAETGEFNDTIKKSNEEMSKLRAEMKLNETQMKATGASVEALENKHKILSNQLAASESKTEALTQKVNKAVEIFGENSTEVTKLRTQLINAQTEEERLRNAVKQCSDALEDQTNHTEAVTESFGKMGDAMSGLVKGGLVAVVGAIGGVGVVAGTTANDIDKATNTFIAKTGESSESAEDFEDTMTSIYNNNYGESFEDIADAMATVKTALGDIGTDELEKVTQDALVLRDTFDMDVNESIRAVNSMMDQFGITADEAYSLIAQGAQNGLNQNGDLLDTVNEYSVQFKNAGYSAEDMFNMLANGVDAGTWSVDKLGDAVKEFNIRASDGTVGDAIEENAKAFGLTKKEAEALAKEVETGSVGAYQKLADKLRSVDDDTQRYQLGVAMFGTMWEDLGEDAVMALLDTQGEISTTKDALEQINSVKYNDLGSAFEAIKRDLQTSVAEPIQEHVMPAVNEFIEEVDWQGVGQTIGEAFGVIVEGAVAIVGAVKDAVMWMNEHKGVVIAVASAVGILSAAITAYNVVQGVKAAMDAANVTTVWALVAAHWAQATAAMAALAPYILAVAAIAAVIAIIVVCIKYWDEIVAAVKKCWDQVCATLAVWGAWINTNVVQPIKEFFSGLWDDITSACSAAWEWVKGVFSSFVSWINTNVIQPVVNFFTGLWDSIKAIWDGICNAVSIAIQLIASILSAAFQIITLPFMFIWENCKQYVFAAWEWIKNAVTTAINAVKSVITTVMNAIKSVISTVWNAIESAVSTAVNAVKTVVSSVWDSIKSATSTAWNAIKSVVSSVWNSIKSAVTTVINAVKSVVSSVWNGIKSVTSSIWNGVKSTISNVWDGIKSKVSSVVNGVKSTVSSVFNGIKSTATSVWNGIKNAILTPIEAAKNKIKSIIDTIKGLFSGMKISWPSIKMPHFAIKPAGWKIGDLLKGSIPKLSISWYKEGAIFTKPTIFGTPFGFKGVGEAGAEAVLPIDKLEGYISSAIEKAQNVVNLQSLAGAIEDLANRPIQMNINGRQVAVATASDGDSVNGLRSSLKGRGLAIE